jgi:hypothetical protein
MASHNPCDTHPRLVHIYFDAGGVPISFPLGNDEVALVTSIRLSLRFQMSEDFMFIDEEVYDAQSGDLIHTIGQSLACDGASKQWLLNAGRYRVYGVSDSVMAASTELVTPHRSSIGTLDIQRVKFLPPTFNGDVLFELPPVDTSGPFHMMHGMDKRHDGHAWTKTVTSNIKSDMSLTFRTSTCIGHLRCENQDCEYTSRIHRTSPVNEREWDGFTVTTIPVGQPIPAGSTLVCKICKVPPICFATCATRIYYVYGAANMTRACQHLGVHEHPVKVGEDQENKREDA